MEHGEDTTPLRQLQAAEFARRRRIVQQSTLDKEAGSVGTLTTLGLDRAAVLRLSGDTPSA